MVSIKNDVRQGKDQHAIDLSLSSQTVQVRDSGETVFGCIIVYMMLCSAATMEEL
jgi:hypothetical protein